MGLHFFQSTKEVVYLSLLKASKDEVINFCNTFKEEKQWILLQMTINDEQNDSSVERSFPTTQPANPSCNAWGFLYCSNRLLKIFR